MVIVVMFFMSPRNALLLSFFCKPIIDIFWYSKSEGYISPLYITAIIVPILALIHRPKYNYKNKLNQTDRVVIVYLLVLFILTLAKIVNTPEYIYNSIDTFARLLFTTLFYFIGKYYFVDADNSNKLSRAILFSPMIPFMITILQLGEVLPVFEPMEMGKGDPTAFYIGGRHNLQRISGVYEGVYELAFMGLFVVLISIAFRISKFKFPMWWYPLFVAGSYFLYNTFSRSAWVLCLSSLVVFFVLKKRMGTAFAVIFSALLLYILVPVVQYRFEDEIGFIFGEARFGTFGYGRGNIWPIVWEDFWSRDFLSQLVGSYGYVNPENQFLGFLTWFGFIGLMSIIALFVFFSIRLFLQTKNIPKDNSVQSSLVLLFISVIVCSYWFAGLGNFFLGQISTQWVLWTWTGIITNSDFRSNWEHPNLVLGYGARTSK
ncbi:MAG: O-antigen ligase family protein [Chloroflexi bacterium]|nr:O-antigen ligase family protein [Chloroflexota bacterium]